MKAAIIRSGILSIQLCVPKEWTDAQVIALAEKEDPCGTFAGWQVRKSSKKCGPERVQCKESGEMIHIVVHS